MGREPRGFPISVRIPATIWSRLVVYPLGKAESAFCGS